MVILANKNHDFNLIGLVAATNDSVSGIGTNWLMLVQECKDTVQEDDSFGRQVLHRHVRIPFTISYFSGNIKMKLEVENNRRKNEVKLFMLHSFQYTNQVSHS